MKKPIIFVANCPFDQLIGTDPDTYLVRESSSAPNQLTVSYYDEEKGLLNSRICFARGQWYGSHEVDTRDISAPDGNSQKLLDFLKSRFNRSNLLLPEPQQASRNSIFQGLNIIDTEEEEKENVENQYSTQSQSASSAPDEKRSKVVFAKDGDEKLNNESVGKWLIRESSHPEKLTISHVKDTSEGTQIKCFRCVCINGQWFSENEIPDNIRVNPDYKKDPAKETASLLQFLKQLGFNKNEMIIPDVTWASSHPYFIQFRAKIHKTIQLRPSNEKEFLPLAMRPKSSVAPSVNPNPHTESAFKGTVEIDGVNLYERPETLESYRVSEGSEITLGDLHANTMKLLFMLVFHGIAHISAENYRELCEIYKKEKPNREDFQRFRELLDTMEFVDDNIRNTILIRLLGDELADRGQNDFFTLLLLKKLHEVNIPVKILSSNHSIELIEAIEVKQKQPLKSLLPHRFMGLYTQLSIFNLADAIDNRNVNWNEVMEIYNQVYTNMSCVLSYTLDKENNGITLYSHAPVDVEVIENLASVWGLEYDDSTAQTLAESIDRINQYYQDCTKANKTHELYSGENMEHAASGFVSKTENPFLFLMWNRDYTQIERNAKHNGYFVSYVHGHDSGELAPGANVRNLDNRLGKDIKDSSGTYTAVCSKSPHVELTNSNETSNTINSPLRTAGFFRNIRPNIAAPSNQLGCRNF